MRWTFDPLRVANARLNLLRLGAVGFRYHRSLFGEATSSPLHLGVGTDRLEVEWDLRRDLPYMYYDQMDFDVIVGSYGDAFDRYAIRLAEQLALKRIREISVKIPTDKPDERRDLLVRCAETALNSKLVAPYNHELGEMVVSAVEKLEDELDKTLVGVKKVSGGSLGESFVVDGVAFKKTFSYAGFEQQPKKFNNPKILLLNLELELKAEKENAEIRIENVADYDSFVDAEWNIIYQKIDAIVASGAQIILSKLPIGDLATQKFADKDLFCAGRVPQEDLLRVAKATGA